MFPHAFLHRLCLSFFPPSPDVLTLMHMTYSLPMVLRLGDAVVMQEYEGWLGLVREPPCLPGGAGEVGQLAGEDPTCASGAQIVLPDDCCPKASSLGCVGAESGLHVGEDILDLLR